MEDNNNQVKRKCHQKGKNGFRTDRVVVRKFESADYPDVERIFIDGLMEMVPDTAFRGLKHHPESLLLYAAMTIVCFIATKSFLLTCLVPLAVLCARCYYSRRVALGYLERAKLTDMGDIEGHYMKTPDSCLWVAVLEGSVVGVVAVCALRGEAGTVELHRMSVDRRCRQRGVGVALGRKVLQYAADRGYLSVVLGTTAYSPAAHQLYQTLGFRCVGVTKGYATPGVSQSVPEQLFYRVSHHHYRKDMTFHNTNTHSQQ
ncbi:N-acetylaspartate synthetase isoform X1 [Oncorhynchus kisutch]|nr:N-acetylaspartate synthetase isoform X1 [Oncorhynchus kisutch]XP_031670544.1 N-acetylaspartate synthetase isoform X1 [Oncorhynchus kisutch]XP_031676990.1 N-acetylaspartate synthetase-like isoform X1 [Oncorhynchus kisutch]XP_031676991.1 N-acetylaspartate synthetase-like isoform X1 [Oncorhynchus kisutch]